MEMAFRIKPTATHINYYFTCKRKLWLFNKNINCEHDSDLVKVGKFYHKKYEKDSINIDNIKIDKLRNGKVFELKKKKTAPEAAKFQVLYYLYVLKNHGIITSGIIKYKENNRLQKVELTKDKQKELKEVIKKINLLCGKKKPPGLKRNRFCKRCSYFDFCFS
ncbi:Dna2/Cas4 domain-containing protein [Candidatus Woesearchaeota archaeon]|nr:Dna2/Cas4 domain-containing protein [Candidatus Woesearchaeota archaeon]